MYHFLIAEHFVFCNSNARICVGCAFRVLFAWTNESTVVVCHIIYFVTSWSCMHAYLMARRNLIRLMKGGVKGWNRIGDYWPPAALPGAKSQEQVQPV